MISTGILRFLIVVYAALIVVGIVEKNWGLLVYFVGAAVLTVGVLMMK